MTGGIHSMLDALDGLRFAGGCEQCDAVTEMRTDSDGVHIATVRHDEWCPDFARRRRSGR